ncbi:MAG: PIN domain-containing protein [Bacteroidetes bacterium]|nr:MAG: PIN domain-containing protein [Bacteroidota bacterium]
MKVFVDANVLVAVLNKEYPMFSYASRVLSLNDSPKFDVYTSPACLAIALYFSEKKSGNALARNKIKYLCEHIHIADTDQNTVNKAISNKKVHDFEDGLEYYSATASGCKCIVTEDVGDFYFSEMEVMKPKEFLLKYLS